MSREPAACELLSLPDDAAVTFTEPWQAQAFALAVRLVETGYFSRDEWSAALSQEIKAAQERGDRDLGDTYYHHWLKALERLCAQKELIASADMIRRQEEWRQAYAHTPHGQPVELKTEGAERQKA